MILGSIFLFSIVFNTSSLKFNFSHSDRRHDNIVDLLWAKATSPSAKGPQEVMPPTMAVNDAKNAHDISILLPVNISTPLAR